MLEGGMGSICSCDRSTWPIVAVKVNCGNNTVPGTIKIKAAKIEYNSRLLFININYILYNII